MPYEVYAILNPTGDQATGYVLTANDEGRPEVWAAGAIPGHFEEVPHGEIKALLIRHSDAKVWFTYVEPWMKAWRRIRQLRHGMADVGRVKRVGELELECIYKYSDEISQPTVDEVFKSLISSTSI